MFYFKQDGENIEKYCITFNKEEIEQLRTAIINNCSFIEHLKCNHDFSSIFATDISLIKNLKKEYSAEGDIYWYTYDKYEPPYLVELMNELLDGDATSIDKILNFTTESIDDKIKLVNQELILIDSENIIVKKEKLKELEHLLESKKLNQSIDGYYKQLIALIQFDLVDSLSISEIERVESFLEINNLVKDKVSNNYQEHEFVKILKKNNSNRTESY